MPGWQRLQRGLLAVAGGAGEGEKRERERGNKLLMVWPLQNNRHTHSAHTSGCAAASLPAARCAAAALSAWRCCCCCCAAASCHHQLRDVLLQLVNALTHLINLGDDGVRHGLEACLLHQAAQGVAWERVGEEVQVGAG